MIENIHKLMPRSIGMGRIQPQIQKPKGGVLEAHTSPLRYKCWRQFEITFINLASKEEKHIQAKATRASTWLRIFKNENPTP